MGGNHGTLGRRARRGHRLTPTDGPQIEKCQIMISDEKGLRAAMLATRLAFLAAGFVMACWAPLIPFAKQQVGADEGVFGLLLLCLGLGAIVAMPLTGYLSARTGARAMILLAVSVLWLSCLWS